MHKHIWLYLSWSGLICPSLLALFIECSNCLKQHSVCLYYYIREGNRYSDLFTLRCIQAKANRWTQLFITARCHDLIPRWFNKWRQGQAYYRKCSITLTQQNDVYISFIFCLIPLFSLSFCLLHLSYFSLSISSVLWLCISGIFNQSQGYIISPCEAVWVLLAA